ncbi:hypothetical protein EDC04DRAFT_3026219 [Pisolithus marmoratus]|nr:hypothetical protein EDC04DRAFT_3026219 [Pisolithus marmoratus]
MYLPMYPGLRKDTTNDGLDEFISFFGLNQSNQDIPGPVAPTASVNEGTGYGGYDNAYVGPNASNQTAVYGGIMHYNTSGVGFPRDMYSSTACHSISEQAFRYGSNMRGTTPDKIDNAYRSAVENTSVSNQVVSYDGIMHHSTSNMGIHNAYSRAVNHGTAGQVLPPYDHDTSGRVFPLYGVDVHNVTSSVGIYSAYGHVVNYNTSNQIVGYGSIVPNGTPNSGIHEPLPPAQYNPCQIPAPAGYDNTPSMDIHEPLSPAQYNQYQFGALTSYNNATNMAIHVPPAPALYSQYLYGSLVGSEHSVGFHLQVFALPPRITVNAQSTPSMASFNRVSVVPVNDVDFSPIGPEPPLESSSVDGIGLEVLPASSSYATFDDLPTEVDDINSPSSLSAESDTTFPDVPNTPVLPSTAEGGESNTTPAEGSKELGYSVIPELQTKYVEDIVSLPLHTPEDRRTWSMRINEEDRTAEHHIIIFKRKGDTPCSLWGVPMLDCISPLSRIMLDAEETVDYLKGAGESHILLKIMWPGYEKIRHVKSLAIRASDNKILNRVELARAIAREFWKFCERCTSGEYVSTDPKWEIGEGNLTFKDISLSSIWNPEGNIWIPAFRLLIRAAWADETTRNTSKP